MNVTAWEKLGELVMQYLAKGRRVLVQGRLRQDSWDDKETGKKRSSIDVVVEEFSFVSDGRGGQGGSGSTSSNSQSSSSNNSAPTDDIDSSPIDLSDIPF